MDNGRVYRTASSGKGGSPERKIMEALKKSILKNGMPNGIYLDTGKELVRVFGEGEGCVKVRTQQALLKQLDVLTERAEHPEFNDDPAGIAKAVVAVAEELDKMSRDGGEKDSGMEKKSAYSLRMSPDMEEFQRRIGKEDRALFKCLDFCVLV